MLVIRSLAILVSARFMLEEVRLAFQEKKNGSLIDFGYNIKRQRLERVHTIKYLRVYFTADLKWNLHVQYISEKGNYILGFLRHHVKQCSRQPKYTLYIPFGRPVLE